MNVSACLISQENEEKPVEGNEWINGISEGKRTTLERLKDVTLLVLLWGIQPKKKKKAQGDYVLYTIIRNSQ